MKRLSRSEIKQVIEDKFNVEVKGIKVEPTGVLIYISLTSINPEIVVVYTLDYKIVDHFNVNVKEYLIEGVKLRIKDTLVALMVREWT